MTPDIRIVNGENEEPGNTAPPTDPFADINALRLDQDFEEQSGARKLLTTVPVRKPNRQEWIHVHPGEDYRGTFGILTLREERESYLVTPHIAGPLRSEIVRCVLYVWQNASNVTGIWPVPLQGPTDKPNGWHLSAHEAAMRGMRQRVRVSANQSLGAYETTISDNPAAAEHRPHWPSQTLLELMAIAFKGGRLINTFDHPVLKNLRGD